MTQQAEHVVIIGQDGTSRFVYHDDLIPLMEQGEARTQRASHVEPSGNQWVADMAPVQGPMLGPYATRTAALAAEVQWLRDHHLPIPSEL